MAGAFGIFIEKIRVDFRQKAAHEAFTEVYRWFKFHISTIMRLPTSAITCALSLACLGQAYGRIDETEKQIIARYGTPVKQAASLGPRDKCAIYTFNGFKILVTFLDGTSQGEEYIKTPDTSFSDAEIDTFLSANAPLPSWTPPLFTSSTGREWRAKGPKHELVAAYFRTRSGYELQIGTVEFLRYVADQMQQKEKARLEGF